MRITTAELLALIEPYDKYVTSHLAVVPEMALRALQANPPEPTRKYGDYYWHVTPPHPTRPVPGQPAPARPGGNPFAPGRQRRRPRRRPGPAPVTFEPPYEEDLRGRSNDPLADLRYEPTWSTRDVARYYKVKTATVRKWIARGHLAPAGKQGASYIFDSEDIYEATSAINARKNTRGRPSFQDGQPVRDRGLTTRDLDRLTKVTPDALITITEAATLLGLSPATIRTWIYRGHLTSHTTSTPRRVLITVDDLYQAARRE
jgi:excisionase family DNA binding protein